MMGDRVTKGREAEWRGDGMLRRTTTKINVVRISGNNRVTPSKNPNYAYGKCHSKNSQMSQCGVNLAVSRSYWLSVMYVEDCQFGRRVDRVNVGVRLTDGDGISQRHGRRLVRRHQPVGRRRQASPPRLDGRPQDGV